MKRKRDKGSMTIGQISGLILSVAVVFVLLTLLVRLFIPIFDKGDEISKSYFDTLKKQIEFADDGEGGEFFMWDIGDSDKDREFYLVYFGETIEASFFKILSGTFSAGKRQEIKFNSFGQTPNRICVCYVEDFKSTCNYCEGLKYPALFEGKSVDKGFWIEGSGHRLGIKLQGKNYVFSEI